MTLNRRRARRLVVDGERYHWLLRGRPTYGQGMGWSPCSFAVEHAEHPGTTLLVTTDRPHPANWLGPPADPVLPREVAGAIRAALDLGWIPTAPGRPFSLHTKGEQPSGSRAGVPEVRP